MIYQLRWDQPESQALQPDRPLCILLKRTLFLLCSVYFQVYSYRLLDVLPAEMGPARVSVTPTWGAKVDSTTTSLLLYFCSVYSQVYRYSLIDVLLVEMGPARLSVTPTWGAIVDSSTTSTASHLFFCILFTGLQL